MSQYKDDIIAGFVVFLIALPLSIGIALAAGAPASAGILSAVLGGILGTFFTGSHIAISGPAAGLIVVILGSIHSLSDGDALLGFKRTLAAVVVAGFLQVLLGLFKMGRFALLAPVSVVNGMLSAIGIIILVKQVPVLLGVAVHSKSVVGMFLDLPQYLAVANLPMAITGVACLLVLLFWNNFTGKFRKLIPGTLLAVALGLALSFAYDFISPQVLIVLSKAYHIGPHFLVHVPTDFSKIFILPSFDIIFSSRSLTAILTIFIVCSLESLLSSYAIDKLDLQKRKTDLNKDIVGKGLVNIFCGCLGAYPIISEIVRSSANIENGAKTKWSNFYHGLFILAFVGLFPKFLNHIPLSALAAVLLLVGFNLAHPKIFIRIYKEGKDQLFIFGATLIVTLLTDLLMGIAVGIVLNITLHLIRGVKLMEFFDPQTEVTDEAEGVSILKFNSAATFLGYLEIQKVLAKLEGRSVKVDFNDKFVDFTIRELLKDSIG